MLKWFRFLLLLAGLAVVSSLGIYFWVSSFSEEYIGSELTDFPDQKVGVMLGTAPKLSNGQPNLYFTYRVKAAAELYRNKKISYLLVSGDNRKKGYNEPKAMRDALIEAGVPTDRIFLDYAGFRTLDSMIRAREVFGQQSFVVISQAFHNERAVFIARKEGIEAYGFNARDLDVAGGFKTKLREVAARVKMVLDLYILDTGPKFLGEKIKIY